MGKSEESDAVAALAKSVGYAAAPPVPLVFSRHGHPANSQACSTCGGLGYIFIESVNDPIGDPNAEAATPDMEQQAVADARNTQFVVDPTTANPDVTDDNNPILLSEESAAPVTGRSCLSCKRTTVEAATFMKLPDSGYCDDCLTSSVARRR